MKQLFFCVYLTLSLTNLFSQTSRSTGLQIGDTVPDVILGKTLQGNTALGTLNTFKGKLIILDFWTTGCLGCILGMPKLDTLQQVFGEKIQTIIICKNKRSPVEQIFKAIKRPYPQTPIVLEDSVLNRLFPHMTVPHHVWIDQKGIVRFITYDHNATVENVARFLHGEQLHLALRKQITDYDSEVALFDEGGGRWNRHIKYHTLFATYLEGVEHTDPQLVYDTDRNSQVLRLINFPYRQLFGIAYNDSFGDGIYDRANRVLLEVKDSLNFQMNVDTDSLIEKWCQGAVASYEATLPGNRQSDLFKAMRRDLNIYSPYTAQIEKRIIKCLILVNKSLKLSTYSNQDSVFLSESNGATTIRNYTIQNSIVDQLIRGNKYISTPIIDETNFTGKVDLNFSIPLIHLDDPVKFMQVQKELEANGLSLEYGERTIAMLVIKDK